MIKEVKKPKRFYDVAMKVMEIISLVILGIGIRSLFSC